MKIIENGHPFIFILLLFALTTTRAQQYQKYIDYQQQQPFQLKKQEHYHAFYNIPPPAPPAPPAPSSNHDNTLLLKPYRFAKSIPVSVSFNSSSIFKINSKGDWRWKIQIKSIGAISLSLIFDQWWIPKDTEVYVYNNEQILGAFKASNKRSNQFATTPLKGESIVLEYFSPAHVNQLPKIHLSRVIYGYQSLPMLFDSDDRWYNNQQYVMKRKRRSRPHSGKCNVDLSCDTAGMDWSKEARAVAVLLTDENQVYCTGVLLNNAEHDGRQLLLTAYHCTGSSNPDTDIIMFNHQRRSCNGYHNIKTNTFSDTLHGLTYLTGSDISDFALFEIQETIPKDYNVYLAGWSTIEEPESPLVGIHHPSGDFKKLSIYNGHLLPTCWSECPNKDHWKVEHWTRGTTEPGSSGSPLFDASHRVVGQLHGGSASCWNKNGYDVYGSFSASWENGLSDYLDPRNQTMKSSLGSINMDGIYLNNIL